MGNAPAATVRVNVMGCTVDASANIAYKIPMPTIAFYIIGLLISASLMMAWFLSSAPLHVFDFLRRLGWKKDNHEFWKRIPHWETTWDEWSDHININLPPFWATLLTCKYCLSFHAAFWTAVALWIFFPVSWTFIPLAALSWPILIAILINQAK